MKVAVVIGGAAVAALAVAGVWLAVATHGDETPVDVAKTSPATTIEMPKVRARPEVPGAAPIDRTKFTAPEGAAPMTFTGERTPVPASGGFAAWTGREGMRPGELEAFAADAHVSIAVALEQRRSIELMDRTSDRERLGAVLGTRPSAEMIAAIDRAGGKLHEATANAQVGARDGSLTDAGSIAATRAAEDRYRAEVLAATGLGDAGFDRLFSAP